MDVVADSYHGLAAHTDSVVDAVSGRLDDYMAQQENFADKVAGQMEMTEKEMKASAAAAFMGFVDTTKSADAKFKLMLRAVRALDHGLYKETQALDMDRRSHEG